MKVVTVVLEPKKLTKSYRRLAYLTVMRPKVMDLQCYRPELLSPTLTPNPALVVCSHPGLGKNSFDLQLQFFWEQLR